MAGVRNLTHQEAMERSRLLDVSGYDVRLDLTGAAETFRCVTQVDFTCAEPGAESFIELAAARVHSATLNGAPLATDDWSAEAGLRLPALAATNTLVVEAEFDYSRTGQGLTRTVDPVDGEAYLFSQFETADAQRAFACFDQPDLKATFTWHARVPAHWRAISNQPVATVEEHGESRTIHFTQSPRMSTYLAAMCAGPYHEERRVHDGIDLGYFCRASMVEHFDVDELNEITTQGFDFYHQQFQVRYPLPKYDQIWAPDFNAGAMENFGAVVHSEALYLFRSQVTEFEHEQRANTILHELAHMWFGDLVTMRWWDDLWLNESFAEWASHWCNARATRFTQAWTTFLSIRKTWGYRQDQLSSTHPVYTEMPDVAAVEVNFDGITYAKGASVIKQLVAYVGEEAFLTGLRDYFAAHAWGNATFDDLLTALERAAGKPLREFAAQWLETAQVNTLRPEVSVDEHGRYTQVAIRQEAPAGHPTLRTHRLAVGLYDVDTSGTGSGAGQPGGSGHRLVRRQRLELDVAGARTEIPALAGVPQPALLLLNDDDLSYAKIRLDPHSAATLVTHIGGLESSLPRALCWAACWDMVRDAELPARDYLALVLRGLPAESDINLVTSTLAQAAGALSFYADPGWAATGWAQLAASAVATAESSAAGGGFQLAWARSFIGAARSGPELAVLRGWLDGTGVPEGLVIDTELRWALIKSLVANGAAGEKEIEAELANDSTTAGQRAAATARALRPSPEAKEEAWQLLVGEPAPPNWQHRAVLSGFWHPAQVALTEPYVARFHEVAADLWGRRSSEQAREFLGLGYPYPHVSAETIAASEAWLADQEHPAPARRLIAEGRDTVARALAARQVDATAAR